MKLDEIARRLWQGELGAAGQVIDALLAPFEMLYRATIGVRNIAYDRGTFASGAADVPVISVGNVAVGGTGKTPVSHWIARRLLELGQHPAILHGGYAADEPELHRRWSPEIPVVVERDRVAAAARAIANGATVLVLDDAFQHRRLRRDLDIVLVAAERWQSEPRVLPRGPWREPAEALQRASLIMITRKTASAADAMTVATDIARHTSAPVVRVHLRASGWMHAGHRADAPEGPALLVSGLAEPKLFADGARQAGADVASILGFPDHHDYSAADASRILDAAAGRPIITSEKDWTKLDRLLPAERVWLLTLEVVVEDGAALLDDALKQVLR